MKFLDSTVWSARVIHWTLSRVHRNIKSFDFAAVERSNVVASYVPVSAGEGSKTVTDHGS